MANHKPSHSLAIVTSSAMQATRKLLITDDNAEFRASLCEGLHRRGFVTYEASDGLEALSLIEATVFDLLIADVHMPRLSGIEVLARVRELPSRLPCILMSAEWDQPLKSTAMKLEPDDVLAKPFRLATIAETIERILATRRC